MSLACLRLGYLPLIDAAPLIVAEELGFAAEEGLALDLTRMANWSQVRDMLAMGAIEAAHMLVPMPVAQRMGLGPATPDFDLLMVLSQGGQAIAVSAALAARLRAVGHGFGFDDPAAARDALAAVVSGPLVVGVPFPFSTQAELVRRFVALSPLAAQITIRTVPPPQMAAALASGEVDAFCVGEPWASHAVETAAGALLVAGRAIWQAAPEKGLVVTHRFAETRPEETARLIRALWRACRWLDGPENRATAAEILARADYLNLPPELCERGLLGRLHISAAGDIRPCPGFIRFHEGAANFPWRSLAALLARGIAEAQGLDPVAAMAAAKAAFRTDLYRAALRPMGAELPAASSRIEGALREATPARAEDGTMILGPDAFFDGATFDPDFQTC
ncbi:NitT/TauT family transport system ATP-binding protein [Rhodobacter viridis]|uniref:NitT/TauT family transport system ATP-binding protein n=1 Tax=Rhodobacter viridis TaxID=1054202 RepID=A0A318U2Y0_9RHOB|nr:ABC transporter substrate-binding protein [Rhodobacter viridis]PYF08745.1 NitT/TauT family transport system ATP-binding protein [Rhodobacter viridis]